MTKIQKTCKELQSLGFTALDAWRTAQTVCEFESRMCGVFDDPESRIRDVRICQKPDDDSYFDVFGEPEGYTDINGRRVSAEDERKEIERQLELDGCWIVYSEVWNPETEEWEIVDSVGMNTGYNNPCSWKENWYVPDLMRAALDEVKKFDVEFVATTG